MRCRHTPKQGTEEEEEEEEDDDDDDDEEEEEATTDQLRAVKGRKKEGKIRKQCSRQAIRTMPP